MAEKRKQFGPRRRSLVFTTLLNLRLELLKKQAIGKVGIFTITKDENILYQATGTIKSIYVENEDLCGTTLVYVIDTGPTFTKFVENTYTQEFLDGYIYASLYTTEFNPDKEHVVNISWEAKDYSWKTTTDSKFEILCI